MIRDKLYEYMSQKPKENWFAEEQIPGSSFGGISKSDEWNVGDVFFWLINDLAYNINVFPTEGGIDQFQYEVGHHRNAKATWIQNTTINAGSGKCTSTPPMIHGTILTDSLCLGVQLFGMDQQEWTVKPLFSECSPVNKGQCTHYHHLDENCPEGSLTIDVTRGTFSGAIYISS